MTFTEQLEAELETAKQQLARQSSRIDRMVATITAYEDTICELRVRLGDVPEVQITNMTAYDLGFAAQERGDYTDPPFVALVERLEFMRGWRDAAKGR